MKLRVAVSVLSLLLSPLLLAKTKMLVEDPNNLVVGRYGITRAQAAAAQEAAETFLTSGKLEAVQKAYAVRYLAVGAGALTPEQSNQEPKSIARAEQRLNHYGVEFDPNRPTIPVAIYDAVCHRVIHGRLYTIYETPPLYLYGRMDDYVVMYIGAQVGEGKAALQK
jgi:hypothetical protein